MNTNKRALPKEIAALVHHVELNRAGWWDKTVHRLVVAAVWLADHKPTLANIQSTIKNEFRLTLGEGKLSLALNALETQGLLLRLSDHSYRIPDEHRSVFEQEIAEAEKVARDAHDIFCRLAAELCPAFDAETVWTAFDSEFLTPLIKDLGANTYRLISCQPMTADKVRIDHFLSKFGPESHANLTALITAFLDPRLEQVRAHVGRMLHAHFCVDAIGLPEAVIQKLNASINDKIHFRVFLDTNSLFALLELGDPELDASATELRDIISQVGSSLTLEMVIDPRTVLEAKSSLSRAKGQSASIPSGLNFANAAMQARLSGMPRRFMSERAKRGGILSAEDWFDPYISDLVPMARSKGIEVFNEDWRSYAEKEDVLDDIDRVLKYEERRYPPSKQKSYEQVEHDVILWHLVHCKRPTIVESPIDVHDWILTADNRLLTFDEDKQKRAQAKIPVCLSTRCYKYDDVL